MSYSEMTQLLFARGSDTVLLGELSYRLYGRTFSPPGPPCWPPKDPSETRAYRADFSGLLRRGNGIAGVVCSIAGATIVKSAFDQVGATLFIAGGVDGEPAEVILATTLADGQILVRTILVPIIQIAPGLALIPRPASTGSLLGDSSSSLPLGDSSSSLPLSDSASSGVAAMAGRTLGDSSSSLPLGDSSTSLSLGDN